MKRPLPLVWCRDPSRFPHWSKIMTGLEDLCDYLDTHGDSSETMFEIGSYAGESAEVFAKHFSVVHCVDPWDEFTGDWSSMDDIRQSFDMRMEAAGNIIKHVGYSVDVAPEVEDGSLSFVYIDADHSYEAVANDIMLWFPKVRRGGFIGGHDYGPSDPGVVHAVNDVFSTPDLVFGDMSWIVRKPNA